MQSNGPLPQVKSGQTIVCGGSSNKCNRVPALLPPCPVVRVSDGDTSSKGSGDMCTFLKRV